MQKLPAPRNPFWRRPAVLPTAALLLVASIAGALRWADREEPPVQAQSTQSPVKNGADLQWPDLTETADAPAEQQGDEAQAVAPGRTFIGKLNLRPRLKNGRVAGYIVDPADSSILVGTPLQPGDVLLEMDGLKLDPARVAALAQNVGAYQDVFIRYERGSATREDLLPLGNR